MTGKSENIMRLEVSDPDLLVRDPLVSVVMITYNHEHFIAEAIESVVGQQTTFGVELIIGEDCSPDSTRQIALEYQKKYPQSIRVFSSDINIGAQQNFLSAYEAARGKYIALCEGDDYWIDFQKINKQVDFLEENKYFSACFHNVRIVYEGKCADSRLFHNETMRCSYDLMDIISQFFIPTCSTMFKRSNINIIPDWFMLMPMGDWALHLLNAQKGPYGYIDEVMGEYRIHANGIWSSKNQNKTLIETIRAKKIVLKNAGIGYDHEMKRSISKLYTKLSGLNKNDCDYYNWFINKINAKRYWHF